MSGPRKFEAMAKRMQMGGPPRARFAAAAPGAPAQAAVPPPRPQPAGGDFLFDLLAGQAADGSFEESALVDAAITKSRINRAQTLATIERLLDEAGVADAERAKVRRTLLVLVALEQACADRRAVWKRAYQKGVGFVVDATHKPRAEVEQWIHKL
jgi:hypothetical protein